MVSTFTCMCTVPYLLKSSKNLFKTNHDASETARLGWLDAGNTTEPTREPGAQGRGDVEVAVVGATKPYEFIGLGIIEGHFPYAFIGSRAMENHFPAELMGFGQWRISFRMNS